MGNARTGYCLLVSVLLLSVKMSNCSLPNGFFAKIDYFYPSFQLWDVLSVYHYFSWPTPEHWGFMYSIPHVYIRFVWTVLQLTTADVAGSSQMKARPYSTPTGLPSEQPCSALPRVKNRFLTRLSDKNRFAFTPSLARSPRPLASSPFCSLTISVIRITASVVTKQAHLCLRKKNDSS